MTDRFELLMDLVAEQAPALFSVGGTVYEGHVQSCLSGVVVAVVRPYGTRDTREEHRWALADVDDIDRLAEAGDDVDDEDPLMATARDLAARAEEYEGLSLAERLIRERGEPHGRSNR